MAPLRTIARVRSSPNPAAVAVAVSGGTVVLKDWAGVKECCLDAAYDHRASLTEIFEREAAPVVRSISEGRNAAFLTYGATGSGKTYTMLGGGGEIGIMQQGVQLLLALAQDRGFTVSCTFAELYDEDFFDLLNERKKVDAASGKQGYLSIHGLREISLANNADFEEVIQQGSIYRVTRSTRLNMFWRSSRFHAILQLKVQDADSSTMGKLLMLDLAGTENNSRTGNQGVALKESKSINLSLFQLNVVIGALHRGDPYIPWRDSKLTCLLEDSLSGNSNGVIFACLSPQAADVSEGLRVLTMASAASQIVRPQPVPTPRSAVLSRAEQLNIWRLSKGKTPRTGLTKQRTGNSDTRMSAQTIDFEAPDPPEPEPEPEPEPPVAPVSNAKLMEQRFLEFVGRASEIELQRLKHVGPKKAAMVCYVRDKGLVISTVEEFGTIAALSSKKITETLGDFTVCPDQNGTLPI
jgi:hypothetical protein